MRCLEKDRARRYETASGLAADITRHLNNEPVDASPPSALYRFSKFTRRNKPIVWGVSAVIISLAVGLGLSLSFYLASEAQRRRANAEAATSAKVTRALQNMLSSINPARAHGKDLTVRELLDQAGATLDDELADQPDVQAALRQTIVSTYESLFLGRSAIPHAQWLIEYARSKYGPDDPRTIDAIRQCGLMYFLDDQHDRSYDYSHDAYLIAVKREVSLSSEAEKTLSQLVQTYRQATRTRLSNSHVIRALLRGVAHGMSEIRREAELLGTLKLPSNAKGHEHERERFEDALASSFVSAMRTLPSYRGRCG